MKNEKNRIDEATWGNVFKILGIRMLFPRNGFHNISYKVKSMQKNFFRNNEWIYFYQGISATNKEIKVNDCVFENDILYNSPNINISISALVGENGSGKSTLVDMIIRILNNLGAAILGEKSGATDSEHLHYIQYVYAELMILQQHEIKVISVYNGIITLKHYVPDSNCLNSFKYNETESILKKSADELNNFCLMPQPHLRPILSELFHTCLFNYSSYAFNYLDYQQENTDPKKLESMLSQKVWNQLDEDSPYRNWLTGLFHKNDGYQTPIVINPKREEGIFNGVKESQLAKERLMSMLFYQDASRKFPFREINKNLHIVGLILQPLETEKWTNDYILTQLSIKEGTNLYKNFDMIRQNIIMFYIKKYRIHKVNQEALNYLVYKTLKIFRQYPMYKKSKSFLNRKDYMPIIFKTHMDNLCTDESHITGKIRRTINFLTSDLYDDVQNNQVFFNNLDTKLDRAFMALRNKFPHATNSDLLPPPIFNSTFCITKSDISQDKPDMLTTIPFEGLSSGERQITYSLSNFVYHLVNIDSVSNRNNHTVHSKELEITYNYVNVIFDEIELYYHPDFQRRFVSYLIHALHNLTLTHLYGINIMLVTHSPFILSDIPSSNVLALRNSESYPIKETFCANIYEMLGSSFFMDYSIGQLAQEKVQELFKRSDKNNNPSNHSELTNLASYLATHIGDEYIRRKVIEIRDELCKGDRKQTIKIA